MREQAWSLHDPDNELRCPQCDARFLNEMALEEHREREHQEEAEPEAADEEAVRPAEPAP